MNSLKVLKVPTYSICDFDIFNNITPLKELVEAHEGDWNKVDGKWKIFKASIESQKAQLNRKEAFQALQKLIESSTNENLDSKEIDKLKEVLKNSTNWSFAKKSGIAFTPKGDPFNACTEIISY